jgi:hypothetical protein
VSLQQLDRLLDKQKFVKVLQEAAKDPIARRALKPGMLTEILLEIEKPAATVATHAGDLFAHNVERLLGTSGSSALKSEIQKALGMAAGDTGYAGFQAALRTKSGYQGVVEFVGNAAKGIVRNLKPTGSTTLTQLEEHFGQYHMMSLLERRGLADKLKSLMNPFAKHVRYLGKNHIPVVEGEHALFRTLQAEGVGPVGRFFGKIGYYVHRIFEGNNIKRLGGGLVTESSPLFGRLLVSLAIFGFAVSGYHKAPEKSKVARFFDYLASGMGGYLGFDVGRHLVHELGLFTRNAKFAAWSAKKMLGFLPWTYRGFMGEMIAPMIVAAGVGFVAQKVSHMIFGDPDKIEQKAEFEADSKRPIQSNRGLFQQFGNGTIPKIPGVVPGVETFAPNEEVVFTPQRMGELTPERIAMSPVRARMDRAMESAMASGGLGNLFSLPHH